MENKKIYIVTKSSGDYDVIFERPVKAFVDNNKAEAYAEEMNDYYTKLQEKYLAIDFDINDLLFSLFDKYLENTNKEYYEEYKEASQDDTIKFDWDKYYSDAEDFLDNKELVKKYMDICEITEREREALSIDNEYQIKCCYGKPFFYVSSSALELEE